MKVLYLADNRNSQNYGCRATSIALSQLIEKKSDLVATIYGNYTSHLDNTLYINSMPRLFYKALSLLPKWPKLRFLLSKAFQIIFRKFYRKFFDYVSHNPEKSIRNFLKLLPANSHLNELNLLEYDFDTLIVNGEGTMIFSTPARRDALVYLMLCYWALSLGKKVFFLNSMFSECPRSGINLKTIDYAKKVLSRIDLLSVRDYQSLQFVNNYLEIKNAVFLPDALFSWYKLVNDSFKVLNGKYFFPFGYESNDMFDQFDFSQPYICVGGSSSAGRDRENAIHQYSKLVNEIKFSLKANIFIIISCTGDDFLNDVAIKTKCNSIPIDLNILAAAKLLSNAELFISGRYHPSIMASLNGTPCIFLGSNSHKTQSLQEVLGYDKTRIFNDIPSDQDIQEISKLALNNRSLGKSLRYTIKKNSKKMFLLLDETFM